MRFLQTLEDSMKELETKLEGTGGKVTIVVSTEKQGDLEGGISKLFKERVALRNAERHDREAILKWIFEND